MRSTRLLLLLTLALTGCTSWNTVYVANPSGFPTRQQVQVWSNGRSNGLHAVRIRNDTLSGIPYWKPVECDSCRIELAVRDVDSMRVGNFEKTGLVLAAIPLVVLVSVLISLHGYQGD